MPDNDAAFNQMLLVAARMRVEGKPWPEIAADLNREQETVSHWPSRYRHDWRKAMVIAIDDFLPELENEALLIMRQHLRSKSGKAQARACAQIMRHCRELRGVRLRLEHTGELRVLTLNIVKDGEVFNDAGSESIRGANVGGPAPEGCDGEQSVAGQSDNPPPTETA